MLRRLILAGYMGEVCNHKEQWREALVHHKAWCHACLNFKQTACRLTGEKHILLSHTHTLQIAIHYIYTMVCIFLKCTHALKYLQSWVNRVQFLLLPWSNNSSSITGLTSQTVPREREIEGKGADRKIEKAADWRKAVHKREKKERPGSSYIQDKLQSSRVLSP